MSASQQPEPEVRCHLCGKMVPASKAVRRNMTTASVSGWLNIGIPAGTVQSRVDLCPDCAKIPSRANPFQFDPALVKALAITLVVLGVFFVLAMGGIALLGYFASRWPVR